MKLNKLHVHHRYACSISHGYAITSGNAWIGGILVNSSDSPSRQDQSLRAKGFHLTAFNVQGVEPEKPILLTGNIQASASQFRGGDQVDYEEMLQHGHALLGNTIQESLLDRFAGNVLNVQYPSLRMTTFLSERTTPILQTRKINAKLNEFLNTLRSCAYYGSNDFFITKTVSSSHGIADVSLNIIAL